MNPSKKAALPPKEHMPTPEEVALLGFRIAEGGEVRGEPADVRIGSDA